MLMLEIISHPSGKIDILTSVRTRLTRDYGTHVAGYDGKEGGKLTAAGLAPTNDFESGIAATLPPGLYTALLSGMSNGSGIGLVEVYDRGAL